MSLQAQTDLDRPLLAAAALHAAALVVALGLLLTDDRLILGINAWIKPTKFILSIGIYLGTLAWLLPRVDIGSATRRVLRWVFIIAMGGEIALIGMQAWRGVPSHFNEATRFDGMVFSAMGMLIAANTIAALVLLACFVRAPRTDVAPATLAGIRLGLLLFLIASGVGGMMVGQGAHAVGVGDGGPGLPFVNWSTQGGDLRIAHFVGLHALQGLPLIGWFVGRRATQATGAMALRWVAVVWALVFAVTLHQAMGGRPLLAIGG